jgi:hypothetical protein
VTLEAGETIVVGTSRVSGTALLITVPVTLTR